MLIIASGYLPCKERDFRLADIEEKPQISEEILSELKRRGVFRVATVYLALSFSIDTID